jgi:hypothetical protein
LHEYPSYEAYKKTQIHHNLRKIDQIWADEDTMRLVADIVASHIPNSVIRGICHGTRNGFEQNYLSEKHDRLDVIGTDISPSAADFKRSVVWDFHDEKIEWVSHFDFVYSNSLDQAWKPKKALTTWLNQIHRGGLVIIEHTELHGPKGAGEMDPFGVRPTVFPYVLSEWFGSQISVSFKKSKKANNELDVWLFVITKNVDQIAASI